MIGSFITGQLWKLMTGAAGVLTLVLAFFLFQANIENRTLTRQIQVTDKRVNDPKNGLLVQLERERINTVTVREGLTRQNNSLRAQAAEDARNLALVSSQLATTQRENRQNLERITKIMALPPQGSLPIDRYDDIDRRLLETLK